MNERYKVVKPEQVSEAKKLAVEKVKYWHDKLQPDVIFLAECSGTPAGYLFKETWRNIYPKESPPKFYRIDPISTWQALGREREKSHTDKPVLKRFNKFLSKRLPHGKDTKVIVYDVNVDSHRTEDAIKEIFIDYAGINPKSFSFEL